MEREIFRIYPAEFLAFELGLNLKYEEIYRG